MSRKIGGISEEAILDATGQSWSHWENVLEDAGGIELDHKELVSALNEAGVENGWWQQQLAVGYEKERGMRVTGETADAGYQVGVQRTLPISQDELWQVLTAGELRKAWLGDVDLEEIEPEETYNTAEGVFGEVRTVRQGERVRLTWQPAERNSPTTLQFTLSCPRSQTDKTTLRFHHEKLADAEERERMKEHWSGVLDSIESWTRRQERN